MIPSTRSGLAGALAAAALIAGAPSVATAADNCWPTARDEAAGALRAPTLERLPVRVAARTLARETPARVATTLAFVADRAGGRILVALRPRSARGVLRCLRPVHTGRFLEAAPVGPAVRLVGHYPALSAPALEFMVDRAGAGILGRVRLARASIVITRMHPVHGARFLARVPPGRAGAILARTPDRGQAVVARMTADAAAPISARPTETGRARIRRSLVAHERPAGWLPRVHRGPSPARMDAGCTDLQARCPGCQADVRHLV